MVPAPRHVELLGGTGSLEVRAVSHDPTLPAQGYELAIGADGTTIRHADDAGLRYAHHTLRQLAVEQEVPAQRIVDHPDFLQRGFMLDISRDRVPTNETLAWLVDVLAELRYNHLELYMEHTFAYVGHDEVWRDASPLTVDDLRWLDGHCTERGISLVANQNTFGHMERWLRHDAHRWRAECPDGAISPFGGRPIPPATLAPTPANADFAVGLVRELASHLTSSVVNISADEPFELGQGASASAIAERGRTTVYLEHLNRLLSPLVADGHHVLFWGDVLRRHPELVARLPESGATAVVWNYEAPSEDAGLLAALGPEVLETLGLPDDAHLGFAAHVRSFVETGYPFWVAAGTSGWNSLLGRWTNARENVLDAAVVGGGQGAGGYLVTDWGDNGHLQPLAVSLLPLVYGAGVSWCAATNRDRDVTTDVDAIVGVAGLGALLAELGDVHLLSGVTTFNGSPLFAALDPTRPLPLVGKGTAAGHAATLELLDSALAQLAGRRGAFRASNGRFIDQAHAQNADVLQDGLVAAVRLARQGAWRLARRAGVEAPDDEALATDLAECRDLQRAAWLASSRAGGLDDSLRHLPER
jgi:hexosaminidase